MALTASLGEPLVTHGRGKMTVALHNLDGGDYVVVATEGMLVREIQRVADPDEGQRVMSEMRIEHFGLGPVINKE